jgi:NAD-dependent deacetylase
MFKNKVIFITGAGISAGSGIPTFRDDKGFWKEYDPNIVCHEKTRKTQAHYDFMNLFRTLCLEAEPNIAHQFITNLQRKYGTKQIKIFTTNIDDFHSQSGSQEVVHLHGVLNKIRCENCNTKVEVGLGYSLIADTKCIFGCSDDATMRNDVILFGENFQSEYTQLLDELKSCGENDVVFIIGNSLSVFPYQEYISKNCGTKVYVTKEKTISPKIKKHFTEIIVGDISNPEIVSICSNIVTTSLSIK